MKKQRTVVGLFLTWVCTWMIFMTGFAASSSQDGIEVTLSTDKKSYNSDEQIEAVLTLTNTNDFEISNISMEVLSPKEFRLAEGSVSAKKVQTLSAGESSSLTVTYIYGNEDSMNSSETSDAESSGNSGNSGNQGEKSSGTDTGDSAGKAILYLILLLVSLTILIIIIHRRKKGKQILSLFLCMTMTGTLVLGMSLNAEAVNITVKTITMAEDITIDSRQAVVSACVSYEAFSAGEGEMEQPDFTLDVSGLVHYTGEEDEEFFALTDVKDYLKGTASGINSICSMKYSIETFEGKLLQEGTIPVSKTWSVSGVGFAYGYNTLTITADLQDGSSLTKKYVIVNEEAKNTGNLGIDIEADTDQDGFPDYLEEQLQMDPSTEDTDSDGLPDNIEFLVPEISPSAEDADRDGIKDTEEDSDADGLTNLEEYNLGTSLGDEDTDSDGLSDGDEVRIYLTNPLSYDTDGDGLSDKAEIEIGSDPLKAGQSFQYTVSCADTNRKVIPTVQFEGLTADQVNRFAVSEVTTGLLADENIPGYIDNAFSFAEIGEFGEAVLSFKLSPELFDEESFEPAIYWFNEETQILEKLENQTLKEYTISAPVSHFSKYIVLNSTKFDSVWVDTLLYNEFSDETFNGIDVAFVLDSSGSMSWNDSSDNRKIVTKGFVDRLLVNDRAAIIDFDNYSTVYSGFTNDKTTLYEAINKIDDNGGTNLSAGISAALALFEAEDYSEAGKLKYIIMLTDGDGSYDSSLTEKACDMGIVIYTVGLGSDVSTGVLTEMAERTGGAYYHADQADKLNDIFELIADESDLNKDSDGDGISDYHEKEMANGTLRLGNGVSLTGINYQDADTDGDGVLDGKEIIIKKVGVIVFARLYSNPVTKDTDQDGFSDLVDPYPLIPDPDADVLLYRSNHEEGKDENGLIAEDMEYNDKDYIDLLKVNPILLANANITPKALMWAEMNALFTAATISADKGVKEAAFEMLNRFKVGTGGSYSNEALTKAVKNHSKVINTYSKIKDFVNRTLSTNDANVKELQYSLQSDITQAYIDEIPKAYMDTYMDHVNGLGITIHDFCGYTVTITDFEKTESSYSGTLKIHYYDDFGLDATDLTEKTSIGFNDWYTLQHYTRYKGAYKPFLTYVDFTVDFEGTY